MNHCLLFPPNVNFNLFPMVTNGAGFLASLLALASSCKLQKIPAKNPKTGIMPYYGIYCMWGASIMPVTRDQRPCSDNTKGKWNDIFQWNWDNQVELDPYNFLVLLQIPYVSKEKYNSGPVCQKWNSKFRLDWSGQNKWTTSRSDLEYSRQKKLSICLPFKI